MLLDSTSRPLPLAPCLGRVGLKCRKSVIGAKSGKGVEVGPNAKITRSPNEHSEITGGLWHAVSYEAY